MFSFRMPVSTKANSRNANMARREGIQLSIVIVDGGGTTAAIKSPRGTSIGSNSSVWKSRPATMKQVIIVKSGIEASRWRLCGRDAIEVLFGRGK